MALLRRALDRDVANEIWNRAHERAGATGVDCPLCRRSTFGSSVMVKSAPFHLDVCKLCQLVWFDEGEYKPLPSIPRPIPKELPPEARLVVAEAELQQIERRERESVWDGDPPEENWKLLLAALGMPVEVDDPGLDRLPLVTWTLGLLMIVFTSLAFFSSSPFHEYGWVPSSPFRLGGATHVSSFFLHGSILHLAGNLYFLLVFGDNVEAWIGRFQYLILVFAASIAGDLAHAALTSNPEVPLIGASAGISGILAYYAIKFRRAKIGLFIFAVYFPRMAGKFFTMPAWVLFVFWVLAQSLIAFKQTLGVAEVSAVAHLGGAAVGLLTAFSFRE